MRSAVAFETAHNATPEPLRAAEEVLWRSWLLLPERVAPDGHRPLLAGLLGQPWPEASLDARCVADDPAAALSHRPGAGRHHTVVPDPACTCGIYASADPLAGPPGWLPRARHPVVTGFVALSGRILMSRNGYRAQRARIVGPLHVGGPDPRPFRRLPWRRSGTPRVAVDGGGYRLTRLGTHGMTLAEWRAEMAARLSARYGVEVTGGPVVSPGTPRYPAGT